MPTEPMTDERLAEISRMLAFSAVRGVATFELACALEVLREVDRLRAIVDALQSNLRAFADSVEVKSALGLPLDAVMAVLAQDARTALGEDHSDAPHPPTEAEAADLGRAGE